MTEGRGPASRPPLMRYTAPPSHQTVSIVLVMLGTIYLAVPFCLLAVLLYRPREVATGYLAVSVVAALCAVALNVRDVAGFRQGAWDRYSPAYNLLELLFGFAGAVCLGLAVGDEVGLFRPLVFLALLLAMVIFDGPLLVVAWAASLVAVAAEALRTDRGFEQGFWLVFVHGSVWGITAGAVHYLVLRLFSDLEGSDRLAAFASELGGVGSWEHELAPLLPSLATALGTDRVAVAQRERRPAGALSGGEESPGSSASGDPEPPEVPSRVLMWPEDWLAPGRFWGLAGRPGPAIELRHDGELFVVTAPASQIDVVMVAPKGRTVLRTPINDRRAVTAVSLLAGVADRLSLIGRLHLLARTDELTGVANRRHLFEKLDDEVARAGRTGHPLSVAMLDLDHFKRFNDTHGHQAGDGVLRRFAATVDGRIRRIDTLGRYGGEEFCLVLPGATRAEAMTLVDDIRATVAEGEITFSAGVAELDGSDSAAALVRRADAALYEAKAAGRNRVVSA